MTAERAQSYSDLMKLLRDIGPAKLQPAEQERIRQIETHTLKKLEALPEAQRLRDVS